MLKRTSTLGSPFYFNYNQVVIPNGVEIHSAQLSRAGVGRQILQNGSSVLVRVISDRGGGKYEGSVAGVRVNISSARPLKPGETFTAIINAKDGTIYLNPKDAAVAAMTMSFTEVQESALMEYLASSGLPSDSVSVSVLQLLKQMGLKIDAGMLVKLRSLALRFTGKEKAAAELLAVISEKGIEASEEELKQLLILLEGDFDENEKNQPSEDNKGKNLLNKINSTAGAWYLLPFELVQLPDTVTGNGCIRLLMDSSRQLKLLNLEAAYQNHKYLFSLSYEGKKLSSVHFNVSDVLSADDEIISLKKRFMAAGINPGEINWAQACDIEGSACALESFYAVGGEA